MILNLLKKTVKHLGRKSEENDRIVRKGNVYGSTEWKAVKASWEDY